MDNFGRFEIQIYRNGQPYGEQQTATVTNNAATFTLRLVAQQTYDFVFWADCSADGGRYDTDDSIQWVSCRNYRFARHCDENS